MFLNKAYAYIGLIVDTQCANGVEYYDVVCLVYLYVFNVSVF